MARLEKSFCKAIYKNTGGFFPTWPLGRQVKLGDVVDIRRTKMDYLGNITDPEIGIEIIPGPDLTADNTRWQSKSGVKIYFKDKGEIPSADSRLPVDKAGIVVTFTKKGGFLFQPSGIRYNRIENLIAVRKEAIRKLTSGHFNLRKVYIIKEVAVVDSYSLTISKSRQSKLEVAAGGPICISIMDMARLDMGLDIKTDEYLDFNVVGEKGGSIFFKGERLKLKEEKLEDIRMNMGIGIDVPEDHLASLVSATEITPDNANKYFEFNPMNLDDLEELVGYDDDDEQDGDNDEILLA